MFYMPSVATNLVHSTVKTVCLDSVFGLDVAELCYQCYPCPKILKIEHAKICFHKIYNLNPFVNLLVNLYLKLVFFYSRT